MSPVTSDPPAFVQPSAMRATIATVGTLGLLRVVDTPAEVFAPGSLVSYNRRRGCLVGVLYGLAAASRDARIKTLTIRRTDETTRGYPLCERNAEAVFDAFMGEHRAEEMIEMAREELDARLFNDGSHTLPRVSLSTRREQRAAAEEVTRIIRESQREEVPC